VSDIEAAVGQKAGNSVFIVFQMAANRDFVRSIWLLLMNAGTGMEEFFTDIDVPVDTELLVAHRQEDDVRVTEVYRVRGGYPLQEHAFGTVSGRDNVWSATNIAFYRRRNNLQGLIMQAATTEVSFLSSTLPRFQRYIVA
jgi:hypothetical protein